MTFIQSCLIAFSMYSKIPVPQVTWEEKNMRYAFCFFPLIGIVIGAVVCGLDYVSQSFGLSSLFRASMLTVLPVIITGGIHLDGYCDTCDALSSYQPREKKLEILKDPHTGAFAIIKLGIYLVAYLGIASQLGTHEVTVMAGVFVLCRALSGLSVVTFPIAKNSGLASSFRNAAQKKIVILTMAVYIIAAGTYMIILDPVLGLSVLMISILVFLYYHHEACKQFGGITGDLAGWFLQKCEIYSLLVLAVMKGVLAYGVNHWW